MIAEDDLEAHAASMMEQPWWSLFVYEQEKERVMETLPQIVESDNCVFCVNHTDLNWMFSDKLDSWIMVCRSCYNSMAIGDLDDFYD